jgi:uncharacterized protein (TIGR00645 family)
LSWLGKIDASSLKIKVASTIVAISSIHLLKTFINAVHDTPQVIQWQVIIHLTFVGSAFVLAWIDRLTFRGELKDH